MHQNQQSGLLINLYLITLVSNTEAFGSPNLIFRRRKKLSYSCVNVYSMHSVHSVHSPTRFLQRKVFINLSHYLDCFFWHELRHGHKYFEAVEMSLIQNIDVEHRFRVLCFQILFRRLRFSIWCTVGERLVQKVWDAHCDAHNTYTL